MSRTVKRKPAPGTDWWSRRPFSMWRGPGAGARWWKRKTHRRERMKAKEEARREIRP